MYVEMILRSSLQISGVGPIGLSQQFDSKVIYVPGAGWVRSFDSKVTSTRFELKDGFSGLVNRIFLESLVGRFCEFRTTMLPPTFLSFHIGGNNGKKDHSLAVEEAWLAVDSFFIHTDEERLPLA